MPDKLESCVEDVMAQGHDESSAYAICNASISDKSFDDTELSQMLKEDGATEWVDTVGRLVRSDVEPTVIADVVKRARSGGTRQQAQKAMAKSDRLEKVGFEAEMSSQFTVFKAGDDDFVVWGPASVEVVDKEGDRIKAKALEKALPQLLKRARLSLEHSDQLVGRILENFETNETVKVKIGDKTFKRDNFPTDVLELDNMEPALFVAGEIFDDSRQARDTRERIENGELNSYSISGEALVTQKRVTSDGESYDDIVDLDLSAVTICEEGMNQKAKFARIEESGDKTASATAKSDDPVSPANGQGEAPTVSAVTNLAKTAIDETMTDTDKSGDNSEGSFDPEALSKEFKSVLDSKLPDGELATKEDTLSEDDVKEIAQDVYKQEDVAGEEDGQDSGTSEAAGRPGEEADVTGEEAGTGPQAEPHDESQKTTSEKGEDDAGNEDGQDSGTSDAAGRPGDETDYPNTQGDAPDSEGENVDKQASDMAAALGIDEKTAAKIEGYYAAKGEGDVPPEVEEEEEEEAPPAPPEEEEEVPPPEEEKGDEEVPVEEEEVPGEEEEVPPPEEEEEVPPEVPPEEESKEGYSSEELEETLPADVWEVVREYIDDEGGEAPEGGAPDEGEDEVMMASKSDDIESAVEKVLSGKGLEKTGSASSPSGETEKSYDGESGNPDHGNNPALATFYGE